MYLLHISAILIVETMYDTCNQSVHPAEYYVTEFPRNFTEFRISRSSVIRYSVIYGIPYSVGTEFRITNSVKSELRLNVFEGIMTTLYCILFSSEYGGYDSDEGSAQQRQYYQTYNVSTSTKYETKIEGEKTHIFSEHVCKKGQFRSHFCGRCRCILTTP